MLERNPSKSLIVKDIIHTQGCRPVLLGNDPSYQVIADIPANQFKVSIGDVVEYEPDGVNFGWLITTPKDG